VARARQWLEADIARDASLTELARVGGVSRFHLLRLFRSETGLPPHAWLMQRRLQLARQRLRLGEPPAAVAAALGFVDQSHLTRRFRAAYGVTPSRYQHPSNPVQS
jgi:AraC-like DNA-binding protein